MLLHGACCLLYMTLSLKVRIRTENTIKMGEGKLPLCWARTRDDCTWLIVHAVLWVLMCVLTLQQRRSYTSNGAIPLPVRPECQQTGEGFTSFYFSLIFKSSSLRISYNMFCSYELPLPTPPRSTFSYTHNCVSSVLFCFFFSSKSSLCCLYFL